MRRTPTWSTGRRGRGSRPRESCGHCLRSGVRRQWCAHGGVRGAHSTVAPAACGHHGRTPARTIARPRTRDEHGPMSTAGSVPKRRRALPITLIAIASLLAFLAIFALWANRQLLNTDNWTTTSSELLQKPAVRAQLATTLVDQLYDNTDVTGTVRQALPPRAQALAPAAAGGLRQLAERGVRRALATAQVQSAWENANRQAHKQFLNVVDGGGDKVSTQNGTVSIDLRNVLAAAANRVGAGQQLADKLPASAGQLVVMRSDELSAVQDGTEAVRHLPLVLLLLGLALFAIALWRAGAWRRQALRAVGIGLLTAGVVALVALHVMGNVVVDELARTDSAKPAVRDIYDVATSLLDQAAGAAVLYGIFVILAAWLSGPTSAAVGLRTALMPYLREPVYAYGALGLLAVLIAWWGPTPATRNVGLGLVLLAFAVLGLEALRRQVEREHPEVDREAAAVLRAATAESVVSWFRGIFRSSGRARPAPAPSIDQLERLGGLHNSGVLDDEEFARAKAALLTDGAVAAP